MGRVIGSVTMRTTAICFLLMLLVGCSTQPQSAPTANAPNETVPDSESVLGDWEIIEAMRDGADYPNEVGGITTFTGPSAIVRTADGIDTTYAVQFDQTKRPKHINWTLTQDGVSMTLYGVYELSDEHLTTCSPPNFDMERPSQIETMPGDGRWLFKLKRSSTVKKSQ